MDAPYGRQLSFDRFCAILFEPRYGCSLHRLVSVGDVRDVDGTPSPGVWYFEREVKGTLVQAIVVLYTETQLMTRTVIRSTCARLQIDPEEFQAYLE